MRLRGHHLLCILGFRGLGYSEAFVANMARVVQRVYEDPQTLLELTDSADVICAACPHASPQGCSRNDGAAARSADRDRALLALLGLEPAAEMTLASAYALVRERLTPEIIAERICDGCEWQVHGYCMEGFALLRASGPDVLRDLVRTRP